MVRDPYWLHAYWELSRSTLARAQAALGQDWHAARPILRLMDVTSEDTTSAVRAARPRHRDPRRRQQLVHRRRRPAALVPGRHRLPGPPRQVLRPGPLQRRQHAQGRRRPTSSTRTGPSVQEQFQKIYQPVAAAATGPASLARPPRPLRGAAPPADAQPLAPEPRHRRLAVARRASFHFEIDAELIVYGTTEPNAKVTLQGEPVQLRPDGTFTVRFSLPDSRQIIPAVAASPDGVEERTIVLAVERNTKELEPMIHDGNEL